MTNVAHSLLDELQAFDGNSEASRIAIAIRQAVFGKLQRRGIVLGLSGGVDSSVAAALAVRALGRERVVGLLMPEKESDPESLILGRMIAARLGIDTHLEPVGEILETAGCYRRRDEAIHALLPEYGPGYRCKLVTSLPAPGASFSISSVVIQAPDGSVRRQRLTAEAHRAIVAATNFKQRARKMMEYYWADRLAFAVLGTPNRLEYDLGFFVKNGDGAADLKPLAHLYKSQIYRLAEALEIPIEIRGRAPSTDTYPLEQSQQEFFFALPYHEMDLCLFARNQGLPASEAAVATGLQIEVVEAVYRMLDSKRRAARYLHESPLLIDASPGEEE